jgi:hypothetical protein
LGISSIQASATTQVLMVIFQPLPPWNAHAAYRGDGQL